MLLEVKRWSEMNAKIIIKKDTIKSSAINRVIKVNKRTLPRKRHNMTFVDIKVKTNT